MEEREIRDRDTKAGTPANKQANMRNKGGVGGCEGQWGDMDPQESGRMEVGGRQDCFLLFSLHLFLPLFPSPLVRFVGVKQRR